MPAYDYRHRAFRTDLETSAVQLTVVAGTAAQAEALAKHYDDLIRICADRIEESSPDVEAGGRDYGRLPVEEGARVRGLHTETSWGPTDIALLWVGWDGRTVTVAEWGQMGDFGNAPWPPSSRPRARQSPSCADRAATGRGRGRPPATGAEGPTDRSGPGRDRRTSATFPRAPLLGDRRPRPFAAAYGDSQPATGTSSDLRPSPAARFSPACVSVANGRMLTGGQGPAHTER
ncbi:hypothetical protein GCM10010274_59940 [Streptomyces lavendofoliae]|uniref:Uncharacterized protein n=1 Tax=Streptomyces lavendofoliae TaxID=67314 RepID=A0A918M6W7_9ACTN|nr:hypothetical protein GCM10010274_59940 [Streptomyces lavendofoliae]